MGCIKASRLRSCKQDIAVVGDIWVIFRHVHRRGITGPEKVRGGRELRSLPGKGTS
jgi:hypothetical protein